MGMGLAGMARARRRLRGWLAGVIAGVAVTSHAGLPKLAMAMAAEGDFFGLIQEYFNQAVLIGGLVISAVALLVVAVIGISKYKEVAEGRATWGDMGMHIVAGVVLIAIVLFLVTLTPDILAP